MKILCDHQIGYLPWPGLFYRVSLCDVFVYLDTVKYSKRSFEARNKIRTPNGSIWLRVPVIKKDFQLLKDTKINNTENWREKHLKSLLHSYRKCEYFDYLYPKIERILNKKQELLTELNEDLFLFILKELHIDVEYYKASDYEISGEKNEYLINICKQFNADAYIFGQLGKDYVDKALWDKNKIKYHIIKYNYPQYSQIYEGFESNLSVIDILFNVGPKNAMKLIINENLSKFDLIKSFQEIKFE